MRIGVYPGSFNPPTTAHVAIAEAAVEQCRLDRVEFVLSRDALGKHDDDLVDVEHRRSVIDAMSSRFEWLAVRITEHRLVADIATGADVIIVGADKWAQVIDPVWYDGSADERDRIVARLPHVAYAPRRRVSVPDDHRRLLDDVTAGTTILDVGEDHLHTSATHARAGRHDWMTPEAKAFDDETGAWSGPSSVGRERRI